MHSGITAWREFSEDMTQGLKNLQDSQAYKKTAEGVNVAKEKATGLWSTMTASPSFQSLQRTVGSAVGTAKSKISASMSQQNMQGEVISGPPGDAAGAAGTNGAASGSTPEKIPEEASK